MESERGVPFLNDLDAAIAMDLLRKWTFERTLSKDVCRNLCQGEENLSVFIRFNMTLDLESRGPSATDLP